MKYKGYTGVVEFDEDSGTLFGHVIGLRDGITFQGDSVAEVIQAFHDSVDDYLEFCAERGESPEKPYSGQFVLRVSPELHRAMVHTAEAQGTSLNALIQDTLERTFGFRGPARQVVEGGQEPLGLNRAPSGRSPGATKKVGGVGGPGGKKTSGTKTASDRRDHGHGARSAAKTRTEKR